MLYSYNFIEHSATDQLLSSYHIYKKHVLYILLLNAQEVCEYHEKVMPYEQYVGLHLACM